MPFTFTMPKLSPTMNEGTITKWHKKEGDWVESGDVIIEVATDKATVEHTALDAGWLRTILVKEGEEAIINQAIAILSEGKDESIEGYVPEGVKRAVKKEEPKASPSSAEVKEEVRPQSAPMQTPFFAIEPPLADFEPSVSSIQEDGRVKASPLAKKIAKEKNLDITSVKGSGPRGRVQSTDLNLAQKDNEAIFGSQKVPTIAPGTYEEEPLTIVRKKIAERLQQAKTYIPHFYVALTVDAAPMIALREQLKQGDIKVTFNDFVVKAASLALKKHPHVNSGFNAANNTIVRFKTIDIAIAVSIDGGLITPIVRHADYKNLGQISLEVRHLADKARLGKLLPEEFKGGSFTISNLGMYGVDTFTAIINPPQAAILAVGGIQDKPVVKSGQVVPGKTMTLTVSADHRVLDGAVVAEFLKTMQLYLENPAILIVH